MSNPQVVALTAMIRNIVCAEAGITHSSAVVRVEVGASAPHCTQEYTSHGCMINLACVGEAWLTDYMEDLLHKALQEMGCHLPNLCPHGEGLKPSEGLLDTPLKDHLQFFCARNGVRIENALRIQDIQTYRQIVEHSRGQLLSLPGIGKKLLLELEEVLAELGLRLDDGGEAS